MLQGWSRWTSSCVNVPQSRVILHKQDAELNFAGFAWLPVYKCKDFSAHADYRSVTKAGVKSEVKARPNLQSSDGRRQPWSLPYLRAALRYRTITPHSCLGPLLRLFLPNSPSFSSLDLFGLSLIRYLVASSSSTGPVTQRSRTGGTVHSYSRQKIVEGITIRSRPPGWGSQF